MRKEFIISVAAHVVVLTACMLTFVATPKPAETTETVAVDVVSTSDLSNMTQGVKNAPQVKNPKPIADTVGDPTPVQDPLAKLGNKEVKAATDTPPVPERKPPEPKPKKPAPPPQADPIAEALKKNDQKPEPKKAEVVKPEVKPPPTPKKPEADPFDPRQLQALLDKRTPERAHSAGPEINNTAALGDQKGSSGELSQTEMDALRARLRQVWAAPSGVDAEKVSIEVEFQLRHDGTVMGEPVVLTSGSSPLFIATRDSAKRAVLIGQPYTMLRPEHYEQWKDVIVTFDSTLMSSY